MDIFEEVNEELEAERLQKFWQKYHNWIIGGFVALFAGLSAYVAWGNYKQSQDHEAANRYLAAYEAFEKKKTDQSLQGVDSLLADFGEHGYSVLAQVLKARLQADAGERDGALSTLISLSNATEAPGPVKSMALLNAAYLTADKPEQSLDYLKRIDSESVFQAHALELQGLFADQKGDHEVALGLYRQAQEKSAPGTISQRLRRRIERLAGPEIPEKEQPVVDAVSDTDTTTETDPESQDTEPDVADSVEMQLGEDQQPSEDMAEQEGEEGQP